MKKVIAVAAIMMGLVCAPLVQADIVGIDSFDYPDGPIAGRNGGYGWDFQGEGNPQGSSPTAWIHQAGSTEVLNGQLELRDTGDGWISTRREFSSDTWGTGAFQNVGIVYFAATLRVNEPQGWLGISAADGDTERVKFGMPWVTGGLGYLGINNENDGRYVLSDVPVVVGQIYRIVGVLDYDNNAARMWIDPDTGDYDTPHGTSADVILSNLNMWNWVNGVRVASGASTTWDDVVIATTFPESFMPGVFNHLPHDPLPAAGEVDVPLDTVLSWTIPQDPNGLIDPNLVSMQLYMRTDLDPNLVWVADITEWDPQTLRASYSPTLSLDRVYSWRVDTIQDTGQTVPGHVWSFSAKKSIPKIITQPAYQVVEAGDTAVFSVVVQSISPPSFQWFRAVPDGDIMLADNDKISGAQAPTLQVADASLADEAGYYCVVSNASGADVVSETALLGIKRLLAYWPFEDNNPDSVIDGSPASLLYGEPEFTDGIVGGAMAFTNDLLYTDPERADYFDICNHSVSVCAWVKASTSVEWAPMVARFGEDGQGWQLRRHGNTNDRICFTTRGTGNDDGTPSNRTVYDGQWHFAVGTFDGQTKKVYIDGVLSRRHSVDHGGIIQEYDAVRGRINPTAAPVSLAGRVRPGGETLEFEGFTPCVLDEVAIYNYALEAETIAQMYANVAGRPICPEQLPYDLDGDCIIDMNDLAKLASEWLTDISVKPTD